MLHQLKKTTVTLAEASYETKPLLLGFLGSEPKFRIQFVRLKNCKKTLNYKVLFVFEEKILLRQEDIIKTGSSIHVNFHWKHSHSET